MFQEVVQEFYWQGIHTLISHWHKSFEGEGDYVKIQYR